jgi:hypothetical protein
MRGTKSLPMYESYINNFLIRNKMDFIIEETNGTKKAIWDKEDKRGMLYRKYLTPEEMKNIWVFRQVKQSFIRYANKNLKLEIIKNCSSTMKNHEAVNTITENKEFKGTDVNHCYWRVAFVLGYINEKLYSKLATSEYKLVRNKALACVTSDKKIKVYKKGKLKKEDIIHDEYSEILKRMYHNIRNYAYQSMYDAMAVIKPHNNFLKYKTDCIYYIDKQENQKLVEFILQTHGLKFETFDCVYIGDGYFIEKGETKRL